MFATERDLERLVREGKLGNEAININGDGDHVELHLGSIRRILPEDGIIRPGDAWKPDYGTETTGIVSLGINDYVIGETKERVIIPDGYLGVIQPTREAVLIGLGIHCGPIPKGYEGKITFGLKNYVSAQLELRIGYHLLGLYLQPTTDQLRNPAYKKRR